MKVNISNIQYLLDWSAYLEVVQVRPVHKWETCARFESNRILQYSIRFETSTIIRNFRILLTVTNFLLI